MYDLEKKAADLLSLADIDINGSRPWDMQVHNKRLFKRVFSQGSIGLGEAYMDGWWSVEALDEFFNKLLRAGLVEKVWTLSLFFNVFRAKFFNLQHKSRAFQIGEDHYDAGNDLYKAMLGKRMTYTCGYWKGVDKLDDAQEAKLDLVCRKIGLKQGQKVLDIGCGWGSFIKFAAEKYNVQSVGITVSKEQVELGKVMTKGLPVEIRLQDYRDVHEEFDHVVSLGMFEHVGYKNYRTFMRVVHRLLKDDGLFLLHTIGGNKSVYSTDPWIGKYIFTNSMLPSITQIGKSIEELFVMEDWHNFSADYDNTLMAWMRNVDSYWELLKSRYGERFYRMWKYYLMSSAGSFRSRRNQLWQIVLSKKGIEGGYTSVR